MSIDEKENRPESDGRAIKVSNCTIYVGRVRIVIDPHLNVDISGIAETHATEDHNGLAANTPLNPIDFIGVRTTKPRSQRQSITTPYATRPKPTGVGLTRRQSICLRPATSQLLCCLHGSARCNYETHFGALSDNCIARTENCNTTALNSYPSRRNSSGRSPIWGIQNGNRLSPLRLVSRDWGVVKSDRLMLSRIPTVPSSSQPEPLARQDRPVDLYVGSRLPVPVRPGPAAARIPRIERAGDVRPPSQGHGQNGIRCATADRPHYNDNDCNGRQSVTSDKSHDLDDMQYNIANGPHGTDDRQSDINYGVHDVSFDYNDTAVVPGQPCTCIDELDANATSEQWCPPQAIDNCNSTGSQPVAIDSNSLTVVSNHPSIQQVSQNEFSDNCISLFTEQDSSDQNSVL